VDFFLRSQTFVNAASTLPGARMLTKSSCFRVALLKMAEDPLQWLCFEKLAQLSICQNKSRLDNLEQVSG
jgi:hypothetical protein